MIQHRLTRRTSATQMTAEHGNFGHDRAFDPSPVNAIKCAAFHIKAGNINWPMAIYITLAHVWACIGLAHLASVQWKIEP